MAALLGMAADPGPAALVDGIPSSANPAGAKDGSRGPGASCHITLLCPYAAKAYRGTLRKQLTASFAQPYHRAPLLNSINPSEQRSASPRIAPESLSTLATI